MENFIFRVVPVNPNFISLHNAFSIVINDKELNTKPLCNPNWTKASSLEEPFVRAFLYIAQF